MTANLRILRFDGLHPDTLGHYFAAVGLLAAVGQHWPNVRGCWRNGRFLLLHESLTEQQVKDYLLDTWKPTRYERWWGEAQSSKDDANLWAERNRRSLFEVNVMEGRSGSRHGLIAGGPAGVTTGRIVKGAGAASGTVRGGRERFGAAPAFIRGTSG